MAALLCSSAVAQVVVIWDPLNPTRLWIDHDGSQSVEISMWFENGSPRRTVRVEQEADPAHYVPVSAAGISSCGNADPRWVLISEGEANALKIKLDAAGTYRITPYSTCPPATFSNPSLNLLPFTPDVGVPGLAARYRTSPPNTPSAIVDIRVTETGGGGSDGKRVIRQHYRKEHHHMSSTDKLRNRLKGRKNNGCCCGCASKQTSESTEPADSHTRQSGPTMPDVPFGYYAQEESQWCWAAVSESMIVLLDSPYVEQCDIVKKAFGSRDLCRNDPSEVFTDHWLPGFFDEQASDLSLAGIQNAMGSHHTPLPWFVKWNTQSESGHYMMIMGATLDAAVTAGTGATMLKVFDPLPVGHGDVFMVASSDLANPDARDFYSVSYYKYVRPL